MSVKRTFASQFYGFIKFSGPYKVLFNAFSQMTYPNGADRNLSWEPTVNTIGLINEKKNSP